MTAVYFLTILLFCLNKSSFAAFAGPYDIIPLEIGKCAPQECVNPNIILGNYKIRKLNRTTYVYSGSYNNSINIGDNLKIKADISIWGNGGWKPNFYHFDVGGVCTGLTTYLPSFLEEMANKANISCPLSNGYYNIDNLNLQLESQFMNSLPYGKYLANIKLIDEADDCQMCVKFICDCVPKRKKKP